MLKTHHRKERKRKIGGATASSLGLFFLLLEQKEITEGWKQYVWRTVGNKGKIVKEKIGKTESGRMENRERH